MADESKYTHVGVLKRTQKKISILASIANGGQGVNIYDLVESWAKDAWEEAKANGLVTDAMLPTVEAPWIGESPISISREKKLSPAKKKAALQTRIDAVVVKSKVVA